MDDFFVTDNTVQDPDAPVLSQKKRKRAARAARASTNVQKKGKRAGGSDEEGSEDDNGAGDIDDMHLEDDGVGEEPGSEEDERETAAQKRLRLAKRYLSKVREEADGEVDAEQMDRDLIAERLRDDALEVAGKLFRPIADKYTNLTVTPSQIRTFKSGKKLHNLSVTCLAVASPSGGASGRKPIYIYSASKDAAIVKWDFWTGRKVHVFPGGLKPTKKLQKALGNALKKHVGHNDNILCMDASSDGQFVATGGMDKTINVWSVADDKHLGTFKQHRDAVSGLTFRKGSNQLYSASYDRTVKLWNIDEMTYIETLFGHQDQITSIDTISRERCITSGSRDRTLRLWKIIEESQLIFRGGGGGMVADDLVVMDGLRKNKVDKQAVAAGGSLDVVAMLDEETFVSGSDSGAISLWSVNRKKPVFTKLRAHGTGSKMKTADGTETTWEGTEGAGLGDDGQVRLWKLAESKRSFSLVTCIPAEGFVNSLLFFEAPPLPETDSNDAANRAEEAATIEGSTRVQQIRAKAKALAAAQTVPSVLYLAMGLGQEHKLGRWWRLKKARNQVQVVTLG
ncbi:pre-rRNA processing protein [Borealophlyctis nickersoniae]|nr:pre-rRNA processing protein [Borealophlyctis nickersoniae]